MPEESLSERIARATDPEQTMRGERPDTPYIEDAEHWLQVYSDMRRFKEVVLQMSHQEVKERDPAIGEELTSVDIPLLEAEHARAVRRQEFWRLRLAELRSQQASG